MIEEGQGVTMTSNVSGGSAGGGVAGGAGGFGLMTNPRQECQRRGFGG